MNLERRLSKNMGSIFHCRKQFTYSYKETFIPIYMNHFNRLNYQRKKKCSRYKELYFTFLT